MQPVQFQSAHHPVQFGWGKNKDGHDGHRLRRLAAAAAAGGLLVLVPASVASADPTTPPGGSARFVVGSNGDSFSGQVPDQKGIKSLEEGDYTCAVDGVANLQTTTFDCGKKEPINGDTKTGFFGGLAVAVLAALGLRSAGKKARGLRGGH